METKAPSKNAKKRPFKQTRELIRLALNEGWTQQQIADRCRTQQSVVSDWKKGSKKGTETQLKPLLDLFGHKLRRNSFRVYWNIDLKTNKNVYFKVEGKVILSESFRDPRRDHQGKLVRKTPLMRLVIHWQGANEFRAVVQHRFNFRGNSEQLLDCSQNDGIWASEVTERFGTLELLEFVDQFVEQSLRTYPTDSRTLPFLVRKALLNHGFDVDGIVEYPAVW